MELLLVFPYSLGHFWMPRTLRGPIRCTGVAFLSSMDKQILTKVGYIKILIGLCGILLRSLKIALWTIPPNTSMMVAVMVMIEANNVFVWLSNIFKSSESQNRSKSCWVWLSVIVKFSVITMIPKCPKITLKCPCETSLFRSAILTFEYFWNVDANKNLVMEYTIQVTKFK